MKFLTQPMVRLVIFVILAIVTVLLCRFFPNAATNPESGLVIYLPEEYEGMKGEKQAMTDEEILWLPEDTTKLKMVYKSADLPEGLASYRSISASLILSGSDSRSLHRPEVCMKAQGWVITKREVVNLETTGGELMVMDLYLFRHLRTEDGSFRLTENGEKIGQRAHYVYWWVGRDDSTPHAWERVLKSSMNNIFKNINDRWGYPSVFMMVDEQSGDDEDTREQIFSFIKKVAPMYQKSLGAVEVVE